MAQKWPGYTLVANGNATTARLVDTTGVIYKQWTGLTGGGTGYSSYLLPGKILLRSVKQNPVSPFTNTGGACGAFQKVDWNGTVLWTYTISNSSHYSHHDLCPMPNGNVMVIAYEYHTNAEYQAAGGTGAFTNGIWSEKVMEVKQNGANGGDVVWQWRVWDHLVQNANAAKSNYKASISDNPQLLNINYNPGNHIDWMHMNGIDYNPYLDQVALSSHWLNEMYVIDHSTTTAEAASHTGGNSGKGGDLLYRWGNPAAYGATGTTNFNVIHDAHWVPRGCPNEGYLVGINNMYSGTQSSIDFVNPPVNGYNFSKTSGQAYGPSAYSKRIVCTGRTTNEGNSQQYPNGNTLICLALSGNIYEVDSTGKTVWTYSTGGQTAQASKYTDCFLNGPVVNVTASSSIVCSGSAVQLTATATGGTSYTYDWTSEPAGFFSSSPNPLVNPTVSTAYICKVSSGGCTTTYIIPIRVTKPKANAGNDTTIVTGGTATLVGSGGVLYKWNTGDTTASVSVSPIATTTYKVIVTDIWGCTDSDEVVVTVTGGALSATASASPSTICLGSSTQLNAAVTGGNGANTYSWTSSPAGFTSSIKNPVVAPLVTTTYTVLVSSNGQNSNPQVTVTVNPKPAKPSITQNANSLSTVASTAYQWLLGNNPVPGATAQTYSPPVNGVYRVIVYNSFNCASDTSDAFSFFKSGIPSSGPGSAFTVYPNPADHIISINAPLSAGAYEVRLMDCYGKILETGLNVRTIDVSAYARGMYMLVIETKEGKQTQRIILK